MPQPLSSRESALFRQLIRNYDTKQYKKGLKAAEQILRKNPDHGDTTAMKALIINALGKTDEAFALAKTALRSDMKSHVCWHVYGLLYRAVGNFEEAIKAYRFALKLESDSPQIQRDLAFLQMQMRDYQGYAASRLAMVQARPGIRQNWSALAIAHYMAGDLAAAERVLTTCEETLKQPTSKSDVEYSEALLFKNTIIAGRGEYERALEHLEAVRPRILDRTSFLEMKAEYLLQLKRNEEAEHVYRALLSRNPEDRAYYQGLRQALQIDENDRPAVVKLYQEFAEKEPRADAPLRIPLDYLEGDDFREAARRYLHRMLTKGVPSTFANLKALYGSTFKKDTIQALVEELASGRDDAVSPTNEENGNQNENGEESKKANAKADSEGKTLELSAIFFLAQHYNYHLSRDLDQALEHIERLLKRTDDSTPASSMVDYHMVKARIWKHYGDSQKASETMEYARSLDERDRYINTKAAKYQLRNDENERALSTMSKFTRNDTAGGPLGDLHDMQCMWYITEDGESYSRQGRHGLALKRFHAVFDIFDVWQEDQFDFHSFSLRKGQLRSYIDMLRWEDRLRSHPFFSRAAIGAIQTYVHLFDQAQASHGGALTNGVHDGEDDQAAAERRKAAKKAKKDQQKKEKEKEREKEKANVNAKTSSTTESQANASGKGAPKPPHKIELDPDGAKLLETTEPLKDAMKFLNPLLEFSPELIDGQMIGFEVYFRRSMFSLRTKSPPKILMLETEKYLLALKCLHAASKLDRDHPKLQQQIDRFEQQGQRSLFDPK
ncbi:MAG: Pyridoxine 4-dehydrogenase [Watsoniomyces obsoletus]|nr:MAG: Pyridoxine 4-dehydrogenase [Watsoniomyces obsoletus]